MKKIIFFLLFVLGVGGLKGQTELKSLGRAPLAAYLNNEAELRSVLKKYNEEIGKALDYFPGGSLGEEVYLELYKSVDEIPIWKEEIPVGTKMYWMVYKNGGILKNVKWVGNYPIDAFVFKIEAGGKIFKFAAPLRCGNVSLLEMKEAPMISESYLIQKAKEPQPRLEQNQPSQYYQKSEREEEAHIFSTPELKPVEKKTLFSNWKIKIGLGLNKMSTSSMEINEKQSDFASLIPRGNDFFYCEDGRAGWLYTPAGKGSPFEAGQNINLFRQISNFESRQSGIPVFIGIERQLVNYLYIGINYFHIGNLNIQYKEKTENLFINEMRFLGSYEIDDVDVYYVGVDRQRNESTVNKKITMNEWLSEAKYEIPLYRNFSILPLAGAAWQLESSQLEKTETETKLYPFREEVISTENKEIPPEKTKETYFHPYVGMEIEFSSFFLRGIYCLEKSPKQYNSPSKIQGGISIKF